MDVCGHGANLLPSDKVRAGFNRIGSACRRNADDARMTVFKNRDGKNTRWSNRETAEVNIDIIIGKLAVGIDQLWYDGVAAASARDRGNRAEDQRNIISILESGNGSSEKRVSEAIGAGLIVGCEREQRRGNGQYAVQESDRVVRSALAGNGNRVGPYRTIGTCWRRADQCANDDSGAFTIDESRVADCKEGIGCSISPRQSVSG